ncbi:MAG: substrate-binding domain-containing protein, partial [Planctomycetes bacterium]|nr:substrate-binding domain-containing protein [Planctomycetota bacterium]
MRLALSILAVTGVALFAGCGGADADVKAKARPRFAFVTNCVADFWTIGRSGVEKAGADLGADVSVFTPNGTVDEQKRILEDLVAKGVDGIAVSPKDPANMTALLDRIAARTLLITHDSDAPQSQRLAYIGTSNYDAGRLCGKLLAETMPAGAVI